MVWHARQNRSLHQHVLALTMTVLSVPRVDPEEQLTLKREGDHFWRAELKVRFMGDAGIELMAIAGWRPFKTRRRVVAARQFENENQHVQCDDRSRHDRGSRRAPRFILAREHVFSRFEGRQSAGASA